MEVRPFIPPYWRCTQSHNEYMAWREREREMRASKVLMFMCDAVITNPDDPKFDLEKYLTKVAKENPE